MVQGAGHGAKLQSSHAAFGRLNLVPYTDMRVSKERWSPLVGCRPNPLLSQGPPLLLPLVTSLVTSPLVAALECCGRAARGLPIFLQSNPEKLEQSPGSRQRTALPPASS